jgi:hypothetical protein
VYKVRKEATNTTSDFHTDRNIEKGERWKNVLHRELSLQNFCSRKFKVKMCD